MTLQEWYRRRGGTTNPHGRPVVLFPDTFNNHLHTEVGVACVEAIEEAGWQVILPQGHLCCGRPLYDYGFLDAAERYLRRVIDVLREHVRSDTPIVGMEPSCLAVFKDELPRVLPHDDDARRLVRNSYHFAEFFEQFGLPVPELSGKALLWGHCHQRATGGVEADERLLTRMGLSVDPVSGGCCGLAGSWGFEAGKHRISMDCGEEAILPAVRRAAEDVSVVANGFSCKTQIHDAGTGRHARHLAEVMRTRTEAGPDRPAPSRARRIARVAAPLAALGLISAVGRLCWQRPRP
ncbi:(Fe-S)-binding protein [Saccharopolyspora sp. CA-218241]|uniref:(Fe-S)-binding protein n=1 Tax=Saccharopolyspora sp. CA-218241 TaxID=3240027 RepID=UPI003D97353F